jgi:Peptidase family S41/Tricorn protease C1 domain
MRRSPLFAPLLFASIVHALCGLPTIALCVVLLAPRPAAIAADAAAGKGQFNPIDLSQRYPASLDRAPARTGYDWTCDAKDVWRLTGFTFSLGNQFRVETKAAQVVLGHHDSNVLWAAVFPDQPGEIVSAEAGQGAHVTSIWLRFHPARLRELFPPATVKGPGAMELIGDAKRLAAHKMRACWQANGKPMVPDLAVITVDLETREGPCRFFSINTDNSTAKYVDAFKERPLPIAKTLDRDLALEVFDAVWNAFDREYAMFVLKPDVDWPRLRDEFRPRATAAKDSSKLADLLAEMLAHLQDLHVAVRVGGVEVPVYQRHRPLNANRRALAKLLGPVKAAEHNLAWCVTGDGIGYIAIDRLTDSGLPQAFAEVLEHMERTRGLILDFRYNGGGSEPLGQEIVGSFLDGEHVYAKSQYRNGPRHTDLTPPRDRKCQPKDPWHYAAPVIVLQGQRTMSSAEGLVLMLSQCPQVTTLGDRTAGSSGNPRVLNAGAGITVNLPRWIDLDAQGKPFDAVGISPHIVVNTKPADFAGDADPVLAAALERLRAAKVEGPALKLRAGAHRPPERGRGGTSSSGLN